MFTCGNPTESLNPLFVGCGHGVTTFKKIGDFIYNNEQLIGQGTYSQVYEGINKKTQKQVAIKVINLQMIKQKSMFGLLFQETQLMSELNHPNVIKCYALMKSENRCYIVTELCKRNNLQYFITKAQNQNSKIPTNEIERILYEILEGLKYLSQKSIIHRDLKSANILFGTSGKIKIADFGFATYGLNEFKDNIFVGTPLYMSPQAVLQQKYSSKTDVWSYGVIAYEMLFGQAPLSNCRNQNQFLAKIVQPVQIPKNQNLPEDLVQFLEGCLQPNSMNRWSVQKIAQCNYIQRIKSKLSSNKNSTTGSPSPTKNMKNSEKTLTNVQLSEVDQFNKKIIQGIAKGDFPQLRSPKNVNNHKEVKSMGNLNYEMKPTNNTKPLSKQQTYTKMIASTKNINPLHTQNAIFSKLSAQKQLQTSQQFHNFSAMKSLTNSSTVNTQSSNHMFVHHYQHQQQYESYNPKNVLKVAKQMSLQDSKRLSCDIIKPVIKKVQSNNLERQKMAQRQRVSQLLPNRVQGFSLLRNKPITYKQALCLVNYCRLLNKVLFFPRYYNKYLKQWLLFLIQDLKDNAKVNFLKESHMVQLKTALQNYYNQYNMDMNEQRRHTLSGYDKQFIPQIKSVLKIIQGLTDIDSQNMEKGEQKQLLACLMRDTVILNQCLNQVTCNFDVFMQKSQSELYLDWFQREGKGNPKK